MVGRRGVPFESQTLDADGDGLLNTVDLCPSSPNPDQRNTYLANVDWAGVRYDSVGDACTTIGRRCSFNRSLCFRHGVCFKLYRPPQHLQGLNLVPPELLIIMMT